VSTGTGAALATITGQTQGAGVDSTGKAVQGWNVMFETTKGQHGSVFVPQSIYNMANVHAMVRTQAAEMEGVLGSTVLSD
jgi:dolichol kinase